MLTWDLGRRALQAVVMLAVTGAAHAGGEFRVCLAANHAPYSTRVSDNGFDYDVGAEVAAALGRRFVAVWHDNATTIQEIEESDFPTQRLARGECDAIFSLPGPASASLAGEAGLALGAPYYGAAFELVSCVENFPAEPAAWRGRRLAIQSQTVAHFAARAVAAETLNYFTPAAVLAAVAGEEAEAGLVWGPTLGALLQDPDAIGSTQCRLVDDYVAPPALRWNVHVATRVSEAPLRADIDLALTGLQASGRLREIAVRYGIPLHAVFGETYSQAAVAALRGD